MPTDASTDIASRLTTVIKIDDKRPATDPFKLPTQLRADATGDLAELIATDTDTGPAEGDRAMASGTRRTALIELERQLRGGYRFIAAIDEETITDAQRLGVFAAYGWR